MVDDRRVLPAPVEAGHDLHSLGDLGYEGEAAPSPSRTQERPPRPGEQQPNKAHNSLRATGERCQVT
jgi:hypothetical protein